MKRVLTVLNLLGLLVSIVAAPAAARSQSAPLDVPAYAAVLRAADSRAADSALYATALASRDQHVSRAAASAIANLAQHNRPFALPRLRDLIASPDSVIATYAALGLGLARDTGSVEGLAATVRSHSRTSAAAAWALGEIREPSRHALAEALTVANLRSSTRVALLLAESKLKPLDYAAVAPFLASPDALIRWAASYAIARQRSPAGARALINARNTDAAFDGEVARELTKATVGDSLRVPALRRLRSLATSVDPHVRIGAARSLATFGPETRTDLLRFMRDRDANVRVAAAQSVAASFGAIGRTWARAWDADTGYMFRRSLLASAAAAGYMYPEEKSWRSSPDWMLRAAAVNAWAGARDSVRSRAVGISAASDRDGRVRAAAYTVLASLDTLKSDSVVSAVLEHALSDPDTLARQSSPRYKAPTDSAPSRLKPLAWYEHVAATIVVPAIAGRRPRAVVLTARGPIAVEFDAVEAPLTVSNFLELASRGYYRAGRFHRVVPAFVAQDGDPRGDGNGGPGYSIRDELNLLPYDRGAIGMALSGPDTGGSQYFLTLGPQPHLDGHYTVFAHVTAGLDVMDRLVEGDVIQSIRPVR